MGYGCISKTTTEVWWFVSQARLLTASRSHCYVDMFVPGNRAFALLPGTGGTVRARRLHRPA